MVATNSRGPVDGNCKPVVSAPLRHPLRVRILEVANEREISPIQFVSGRMWPDGVRFKSAQHALSHVSYHFRALEKAGCISVVGTCQRRGATEHLFRGAENVFYDDEDSARMPKAERRELSRSGLQSLIARADSAILADAFDSRFNRHLTVMPMALDERGWEELVALLAGCLEQAMQVRREAGERLARSGEEPIPATVGILGFESPPTPSRSDADSYSPISSIL